jgi:hypothetical protein
MLKYCVEINRLENVADGSGRLSRTVAKSTGVVTLMAEIYEHMETVTDRCEVSPTFLKASN